MPQLLIGLTDADAAVRSESAMALGKAGDGLPSLRLCLLEPLPIPRGACVPRRPPHSDELLGIPSLVAALARALHDPDVGVRENAVAALGEIGREQEAATLALIAAFEDEAVWFRSFAVFTLGLVAKATPAVLRRDPARTG